MKELKVIPKQMLKLLKVENLLTDKLRDILEEPIETRGLLSLASKSSSLEENEKILCNDQKYLLFDNTLNDPEKELGLRVISTNYLDEVLAQIVTRDDAQILKMVTVEYSYGQIGIDMDSVEYYGQFVTYVQSVILEGETTNWYIEMSDYIVEYLYNWFGTKTIKTLASMIGRENIVKKKNDVEQYLEQLSYVSVAPEEKNKTVEPQISPRHEVLHRYYCEVCGDAWVETAVEVKYPHYACTTCRDNDEEITFGNSIEFDNAEDYGN